MMERTESQAQEYKEVVRLFQQVSELWASRFDEVRAAIGAAGESYRAAQDRQGERLSKDLGAIWDEIHELKRERSVAEARGDGRRQLAEATDRMTAAVVKVIEAQSKGLRDLGQIEHRIDTVEIRQAAVEKIQSRLEGRVWAMFALSAAVGAAVAGVVQIVTP